MGAALSLADLVVSRAGASTLAELTAMGTPSILMPYPYHRDRHQFANAGALADAGAAVLLEDRISADENAPRLGPILTELMTNDAKRDSMAAAAQAMSKPEAADTVVSYWLTEGVVERGRSRESPLRNPVNGENGARATMMRAGVAIDPGESVVPIHNAE
jgi:UDP-N-acetylglucosamine:LPS N-acetylglucosamine transferase